MTENISYTPDEVAKILKISKFTVYELIKRGDLTAYHIGRKVRVENTDLEHYKNRLKGLPSSPNLREPVKSKTKDERLIICGQDIVLDILTRHLSKQFPHINFLRQYIGSIDGLMSLYRGDVDITATHLWDSDADDYNVAYVRRLLPGHATVIINLMYRMEGFFVAKGNPKNIQGWKDLSRSDLRFINRERGSGARVLLDEQLKIHGIDQQTLNGYHYEEMSHLAVASCVSRGDADFGLGIEKAALQVSTVDFIPLKKERYDLVFLKRDLASPQIQALISILKSSEFKIEVLGIGNYDVSQMGKIISES